MQECSRELYSNRARTVAVGRKFWCNVFLDSYKKSQLHVPCSKLCQQVTNYMYTVLGLSPTSCWAMSPWRPWESSSLHSTSTSSPRARQTPARWRPSSASTTWLCVGQHREKQVRSTNIWVDGVEFFLSFWLMYILLLPLLCFPPPSLCQLFPVPT